MNGDKVREGVSVESASMLLIGALVLCRLLLPLFTRHPAWGIHRDEFLYFAMADHLDLMRMQFPPLIAMVAWAGRAAFDESVLAARAPAAMAGALLTAVVLLLIRRLGGGSRALLFAWLALIAAPVFVRSSLLMQPVIFDQLWATVAISALLLAAHERQPRWWLVIGIALGLGALTKFSVAFIAISIAAATLFVFELRDDLRSRWPWIAAALAGMLSLPSFVGQVLHEWPFLQQMRELRSGQLEQVSMLGFVGQQPLLLAAAMLCVIPAVIVGVRGLARDRVPLVVGVTMFALMLFLHGKAYYVAPVYPVLIGTGALALERWLVHTHRAITALLTASMVASATVLWPMGIPVLSPQRMPAYLAALGVEERTNQGEPIRLPQDYADMLGWRELSDSVAAVIRRLPTEARSDLTVIGSNYGEAGALAFYGASRGIPYPRSTAGDFFAWGPGPASGNHVLVTGSSADLPVMLGQLYDSVSVAAVVLNPMGVPEEQRVSIFRGDGARRDLRALWPSLGPNWR
jgi:hypothetical protein